MRSTSQANEGHVGTRAPAPYWCVVVVVGVLCRRDREAMGTGICPLPAWPRPSLPGSTLAARGRERERSLPSALGFTRHGGRAYFDVLTYMDGWMDAAPVARRARRSRAMKRHCLRFSK